MLLKIKHWWKPWSGMWRRVNIVLTDVPLPRRWLSYNKTLFESKYKLQFKTTDRSGRAVKDKKCLACSNTGSMFTIMATLQEAWVHICTFYMLIFSCVCSGLATDWSLVLGSQNDCLYYSHISDIFWNRNVPADLASQKKKTQENRCHIGPVRVNKVDL
jgi:hypothetical protein